MPLSAQATMALIALATPALACPPDWSAPPSLGEVTFSLENGLSNLAMTSRAGGNFNLRDCGLEGEGLTAYRGDGLIHLRPNLLLHWRGDAPQLVFGSDFEEDILLLIRDPDGRWLFDDSGGGHDPLVSITAAPTGDYAIFLGSRGTTLFTRPGTLIISATGP